MSRVLASLRGSRQEHSSKDVSSLGGEKDVPHKLHYNVPCVQKPWSGAIDPAYRVKDGLLDKSWSYLG